jgi:hypothetical protein
MEFFKSIFGWVEVLTGTPLAIFILIALLVIVFLIVAGHSWYIAKELGKLAEQLRNHGDKAELLQKEPYKHLWSEYEKTVHQMENKDGSTEYRATLPAEAFFSKETLVDNRKFIWNDFFRHLPGILTGLGIIGTFAGLITGLEGFAPSDDAGTARQSLTTLLHGVQEAFHLSAFAITCAIVATFLEKSLLTWAYKNVERLTHAIDALYDAGAGEDYLARLVEADEANAVQTAQLKDSLVNELKTLLVELTDRQIQAQENSSIQLGQVISGSLGEVKSTLGDLHSTFSGKSSADTDNIKGALDSLIAAFIDRINSTLGEQMQAIQISMQQSTQTMQQVEQSLNGLVNNIAKTTSGVMEDVVTKMEDTMQKAASNQEQMTLQMGEFVNQLRTQMETQQVTSHDTMQKTLAGLLQTMQAGQEKSRETLDGSIDQLLDKLKGSLSNMAQMQETQHNQLTGNIEEILKQVGSAVTIMQGNVTELRRTTTDAISGMNSGADRMKSAADHFTTAGQSVSGVLDKATPVATQLATSSNALGQASQQLANLFAQQQQIKNETTHHIETLQQLLQSAKQEVDIKKDLINDIQRVTDTLRSTENQSLEYLDKVNDVLVNSFRDFGSAMAQQVSQNITQTDKHLSSGVNQLTGVVEELGAQLQKMRNRS